MIWILAFLTGFFSLCVQVVATQFAFYSQPQSSHAIGLSLFAFLVGLGVAARLTHQRQDYLQKNFRTVVALAFGGVGVFFLWLINHAPDLRALLQNKIPTILPDPSAHYLATIVSQSMLFLLMPALGLGLLFPLLNDRITLKVGTQTGATTSWDYFGAGLGSLVCAFGLIPYFGMQLAGAMVSAMLIVVALIAAPTWRYRAIGAVFIFLFIGAEFPRLAETFRYSPPLSSHVLMSEPSPFGEVRVTRNSFGQASLHINGRGMCDAARSKSERLLASGPLKNLPNNKASVLNVGLGCGFTAFQFKVHEKVQNLDVVEINPTVIKAQNHFNLNLLGNFGANTRIHVGDGYKYVENSSRTYDVIAVDVEEPSIIHSSPLFTADFFRHVKAKMNDNGVFTVWTFNQPHTGRIILNTLKSVFAFADVVVVQGHLVFLAANSKVNMAGLRGDKKAREILLKMPQTEVATIAKNPYPKYFSVNEVFKFPPEYTDAFEIKAAN